MARRSWAHFFFDRIARTSYVEIFYIFEHKWWLEAVDQLLTAVGQINRDRTFDDENS